MKIKENIMKWKKIREDARDDQMSQERFISRKSSGRERKGRQEHHTHLYESVSFAFPLFEQLPTE